MKIVHVSDLHLDKDFKRTNIRKVETLLKFLSFRDIDHLVITGDISHNVKMDDYIIFRDLLKAYGFMNTEKTSIVIGNHDIFGGVVTAEDVIDFPNKCKETIYEDKVDSFFSVFSELFDSAIFANDKKSFPYLKVIKDALFIGINSNAKYSLIKNLFASNGKVSKTQISNLHSLFENNLFNVKKKIVLIHHHFSKFHKDLMNKKNPLWDKVEKSTMKLRGKKKLMEIFKTYNIDLVLHGHVHEMGEYEKDGIHFINAGASIDNYDEEKIQYNEIKIEETQIKTAVKEINKKLIEIPFTETA